MTLEQKESTSGKGHNDKQMAKEKETTSRTAFDLTKHNGNKATSRTSVDFTEITRIRPPVGPQ